MLSLYPFDISVSIRAFVIGLSQISPLFALTILKIIHEGPQDTIIFHIHNEKVGANGE